VIGETMRKRLIELTILVALAGGIVGAQSVTAVADAGPHASCLGFEASGIAPAGTSDEFPGGVTELLAAVRTFGVPIGYVYRDVAKLHEGSHGACDEATE
jgi:hypothetical protein